MDEDLVEENKRLRDALEALVSWVSMCEANVTEYPGWSEARAALDKEEG